MWRETDSVEIQAAATHKFGGWHTTGRWEYYVKEVNTYPTDRVGPTLVSGQETENLLAFPARDSDQRGTGILPSEKILSDLREIFTLFSSGQYHCETFVSLSSGR